jgi:hypothetical protein
MRGLIGFLALLVVLVSCGASKNTHHNNTTSTHINESQRNLVSYFKGVPTSKMKIRLKNAEALLGIPYKYGGTTTDGFDCSGLVCKVFEEKNIKFPRRSIDQAQMGQAIPTEKIQPGDLLFFATSGGDKVSHVGIAKEIEDTGEIKFIHASTSKGVMISSLSEKYWNKAFLFARRTDN